MSLDGTLDVDADADAVTFTFTVRNAGDEPVEMQFSDACTADVAVSADGEEVWRFSHGRMFAQMLQHETLAPGEELTEEMTWDAPDGGEYDAVATLEASDADCEARATFSV